MFAGVSDPPVGKVVCSAQFFCASNYVGACIRADLAVSCFCVQLSDGDYYF